MTKWKYGFLSIIFLFSGICIYLFFRDLNIYLFEWLPKPSILNLFYINLKQTLFIIFLKYHLPDILWVLSGIFIIRFIWFSNNKYQKIYLFIFYTIAIFLEFLQIFTFIYGTFDIMDLFFIGISIFIEDLLYKILVLRSFIWKKEKFCTD